MRRFLFAAVLCAATLAIAATSAAAAPSVDDVIARMNEVMSPAKDVHADLEIVQQTASGAEVRWKGDLYREAGESARQRIVFSSPADIAGTELLFQPASGTKLDRIRMFLPALGRTRTIRTEMLGAPFLGTDFDYENLGLEQLTAEQHALEGESDLDGRPVYRVVSQPQGSTWVKRVVRLVDRKTFVPLRTEYYDAAGTLYKVRTIEVEPGSPPAEVRVTMKTVPESSTTVLILDDVRFGKISAADLAGRAAEPAKRES